MTEPDYAAMRQEQAVAAYREWREAEDLVDRLEGSAQEQRPGSPGSDAMFRDVRHAQEHADALLVVARARALGVLDDLMRAAT